MTYTNNTPRGQVYVAIDTERDYQDTVWAGHKHEVAGYITMMTHYHQKLVEAWTVNAGDSAAMEVMRKIAGIAVHCMEVHGAPHRQV